MGEMRAHASSGNMRPPTCVSSADGTHNNSCPQVLHSQLSAPAAELAHAAGVHSGQLFGTAHNPSPLGSQQPKKPQPGLQSALGGAQSDAVFIKAVQSSTAAATGGFLPLHAGLQHTADAHPMDTDEN
jgi:hypothetical protein